MASVKSHFEYCPGEGTYVLEFRCTGPSCSYLNGFPGTTCQTIDQVLTCSNGVKCTTASNYSSDATFTQHRFKVERIETIKLADFCQVLNLNSDGTVAGTNLDQEDIHGCRVKDWVRGGPTANGTSHSEQSLPSSTSTSRAKSSHDSVSTKPLASTTAGSSPTLSHFSGTKSIGGSPTSTRTAAPIVVTASGYRKAPAPLIVLFTVWMTLSLLIMSVSGSPVSPLADGASSLEVRVKDHSPTTDLAVCPNIHARSPESLSDLDSRALGAWTDALLSNMGAFLANKLGNSKFEDGLLLELYSFVCSQVMYYLVNGVLYGYPAFFINTCVEIVLLAFAPTGPGVLLGTAVGYTVCSYALNKMLETALPGLMDETCNSVMKVARDWFGDDQAEKLFQPRGTIEWFDLENDPKNCGQVGFECPTDSLCVHAACIDQTCTGQSSAGHSCGAAGSGCFCAPDPPSGGFCVLDTSTCGDVVGSAPDQCQNSDQCRSGHVCAESPSCGRRLCLNAVSCNGSGGFGKAPSGSGHGSDGDGSHGGDVSAFPPKVTPASTPKSGWQLSFESFVYLANDFSLPKDWYVEYDGKLTVNTRCIAVQELEFSPVSSFRKDAHFTFETLNGEDPELYPNADSCCLGLFGGTKCDPNAADSRLICRGVTSQSIPFETKAWMVYGCRGLWTGKPA